jgi:SHS2 domain-containing protein
MMKEKAESGFLELAHTADWALKVWAPNLVRLLSEAARGMYVLMELELAEVPPVEVPIALEAYDGESLLVAFLGELLYFNEDQGLAFTHFELDLQEYRLNGIMLGAPVISQRKEIKAVTYHELEIVYRNNRYEATIVFDV